MESIIIAAPYSYDVTLRSRIPGKYVVREGDAGTTVIEDGNTRIYVSQNESIRSDLEDRQLATVIGTIPSPVFYSIDFSDVAFCRDILLAIADDPDILVDNDHGVMLPGSEFVRVLRSQHDWDWRRDRP